MSVIESNSVHGFRLHAAEVRILAYADDIAVFCADYESVRVVVQIVKDFCSVSGSAVNWAKCLGFWHGDWPLTPTNFANMTWTATPVKYLGVPLENYRDSEPYWKCQVAEMREKADRLKGFSWSIFARATICNLFL